jgi:hypothetical protein
MREGLLARGSTYLLHGYSPYSYSKIWTDLETTALTQGFKRLPHL